MRDDMRGTTRRQYLQAIGTATLGATALQHVGSTQAQTGSDELLLNDDFEEYDIGSFPNSWSRSGNNNQQVVSDPVASGEQALQMVGSHGGCWQALAHYELAPQLPSDETIVFSGQLRPTGDGGGGCHGTRNCTVSLQDLPAPYGGRNFRQALFTTDASGSINGRNVDPGTYEVGSYNSFEVEYYWDSNTDKVELSYRINGENRGTGTIDATTDDSGNVVESELVYFTVTSGDYTLYVDNISVERGEEVTTATPTTTPTETATATATLTSTATETPEQESLTEQEGQDEGLTTQESEDDDSGGIPVLNRFGDSGSSISLILLGLLGGAGGYAAIDRLKSGDQEDRRRDQQYD